MSSVQVLDDSLHLLFMHRRATDDSTAERSIARLQRICPTSDEF